MAHSHDHHHHDHDDHDHHHGPQGSDPYGVGDPAPSEAEAPLDAANQSLADALRSSFNILKGIMVLLVIIYSFSNVRCVGEHQRALILRFGDLLPDERHAGLVWAWPFPVDELVLLPAQQSNDVTISSQTFSRDDSEKGKPIKMITRSGHKGLDPSLDGALLTADRGLVHVEWQVTYKISDIVAYIRHVQGDTVEAAQDIIRTVVETTAVGVASEMEAEDILRRNVKLVQDEMILRTNRRLTELETGVEITLVEMIEPTPPLSVREAFDRAQAAAQQKDSQIRVARKKQTETLSGAAGESYERLVALLEQRDAAADPAESSRIADELGTVIRTESSGKAGELIKSAQSYYATHVGRMQGDVDLYRTLIPEYERNPRLLVARLWEQTRNQILSAHGVEKIYVPSLLHQVRVRIAKDPEQRQREEQERLHQGEFDPKKMRPEPLHPLREFRRSSGPKPKSGK